MAYVQQRGERYTGYYRDKLGKKKSAGTFDTMAEALVQATKIEESGIAGGYRLTMPLSDYVRQWLPTADLLPMTKKSYESVLRTHVLPILGRKPVGQLQRSDVRQMLDVLRQTGHSSTVRQHAKAALGSALKALVEVDQLEVNPAHKIAIKKIDQAPYREVLDADTFKQVIQYLPTDGARLFASFLVSSGLRFGEASELRVKDLSQGEVYVQRRVSDIGAIHNDGSRFLVLQGTKSGRKRSVGLSKPMMQMLQDHIQQHGLQKENLLFSKSLVQGSSNTNKLAVANNSGHLPRDTWRRIWKEAVETAGLGWLPRTHDLRHTNATVMLKNGIDLHEVKERLGHSSIRTTEGYLHRLKAQQSKASDAVAEFL